MILNVYYASRASSEICYGNTRGIKAISDSRSRIQILLSSCNNIINSLSGERKQEWNAPLLDSTACRQMGLGARYSSVVSAFAHGVMARRVDSLWWTH